MRKGLGDEKWEAYTWDKERRKLTGEKKESSLVREKAGAVQRGALM